MYISVVCATFASCCASLYNKPINQHNGIVIKKSRYKLLKHMAYLQSHPKYATARKLEKWKYWKISEERESQRQLH